ncbi:MAG TPA: AAA family ATPase [Anaerolineae bacterium]|nr:AAA family ATPase [Anaerolineae bacterium]
MRAVGRSKPLGAEVIARMIIGEPLARMGVTPDDLGEPWATGAKRLEPTNGDGRRLAAEAWLNELPDGDSLRRLVFACDPLAPLYAFPTWAHLDQHLPSIEWEWQGWLPRGLLTLIVGAPGEGKSALALALAGCVIQGACWPDGVAIDEPGLVVWCETESAQAVNLNRARSWGLPLDRILMPRAERLLDTIQLDTAAGWEALETVCHRPGVRLVVVDSLSGAHRGDENSAELRNLLTSLANLAQGTGLALLVVHHLRKKGLFDSGKIDLDRVRGSSVIVQWARVVLAIDRPNPEHEPDSVRLSQIKNNLARYPQPLGFEISEIGVGFGEAPEPPRIETQLDKSCDLLLALLADGPLPANDLFEEGEGAGLSKITLKRAKKKLGIVALRQDNRWLWSLPARDESTPQKT